MAKKKLPRVPGKRSPKASYSTDIICIDSTSTQSYARIKAMISTLPSDIKSAVLNTKMERGRIQALNEGANSMANGVWSVMPMVCCGNDCPYSDRCPFLKQGIPPIGADCPVEKYNMQERMSRYMEELDIDTDHFSEMDQAATIAMCDIMLMRIRNAMAMRPNPHMDMVAAGVDDDGNVMLKRDLSVEVRAEEKYLTIKRRLMESLLATREVRARYKQATATDESVRSSRIRKAAQEVLEKTEVVDVEVSDIEGSEVEEGT